MTKGDLYKEILKKLVKYLKGRGDLAETDEDRIRDELDLSHYEDAASVLINLPGGSSFKKIIQVIQDGLDDMTEINNILPVRHNHVTRFNDEKLKPFYYKKADMAILPVQMINHVVVTQGAEFDSANEGILDLIWLFYKDNIDELNYFWECCKGEHIDDYFILTAQPQNDDSDWRLYSYAYFCYVNEKRFERPQILDFNRQTPYSSSILFNPDNKYEQYFDVYNVMSESKYSEDVLSRYLRMYQVLEYMAYRRALVDMTKGNIKENGFVRNVITQANKGSKNEFDELKKGLNGIISIASVIVPTDITSDMDDFIHDRLMIYDSVHESKMWKVIYQLRNCIVHNKESELHFMYTNTGVYEAGIKLMNLFIQKIEPKIAEVINDSNVTNLDFDEQNIRVY